MNLVTREKNFMKTVITIKVVQDKEPTVEILDAIELAFGEFERIVKQYTRFDESSELSNLNRNCGNWVKVTEEFFKLIKFMLNLAEVSDGAFDPTIIDFLDIYGYNKNYDYSSLDNPELNKIINERLKVRPSFREIELDEGKRMVKLANDQRIDLGGVGKGYAIDCAHEKLSMVCKNFLIDAGGDIRAEGKNEKSELWRVSLLDMNDAGEKVSIGYVDLENESLASSGSWARKIKQFHHLLSPRTGTPQNFYRTVYVQAPLAIDSDSWATTLFVGGEAIKKITPENFKVFTVEASKDEPESTQS
jgi:FAD:protein FMN transferase